MNNSVWISVLRALAWSVLVICVLVGVIFGFVSGSFLVFIIAVPISVLVGVLAIAAQMLVLDLAEDIRAIRNTLCGTATYASSAFASKLSAIGQVAVDHMKQEEELARAERILKEGGWQCANCGKVHPKYTGTCGCGNTKYENQ